MQTEANKTGSCKLKGGLWTLVYMLCEKSLYVLLCFGLLRLQEDCVFSMSHWLLCGGQTRGQELKQELFERRDIRPYWNILGKKGW